MPLNRTDNRSNADPHAFRPAAGHALGCVPTEAPHRQPSRLRAPSHRRPRRIAQLLAMLLTLVSLMIPNSARAQELDVDTVLDNITTAARALDDATFMLTGKLVNPDGTTFTLEIEIQVVPPAGVASAYIIQPDALADNQIVLDGDAVYNYTYLTNQVMIFDANDPDALGGLLPQGEDGASANISFDLGTIFAGYVATITKVFEGPFGETYELHFANKDPEATILDVDAQVPSSDWLPRKLVFKQADGHVLAELNAEDLKIDTGLTAAEASYLPDDAEVIDNRKQ